MNSNQPHKVPAYFGLRIFLTSTILYFLLVFPVAGILLFKYIPDFMEKENTPFGKAREKDVTVTDTMKSQVQMALKDTSGFHMSLTLPGDTITSDTTKASPQADLDLNNTAGGNKIGGVMALLAKLLLASFILGFAFNLPFKMYFRKIRKHKPVSDRLKQFCKMYLLRTPLINTLILVVAYGITVIYMLFEIFFRENVDDLNRQFYLQFFFITIVSSILTLLLVYMWQRHRVHIRYLEHIFTRDELKKRVFKISSGTIRNRLWISSAMTTLLPLVIVLFYLLLSVTSVKELGIDPISKEQMQILLGKFAPLMGNSSDVHNLFYVNVINSILMIAGIASGIFVALIYIVLVIRWTTEDIVQPVTELLANMKRAGSGELDSYSIVRTNDEIGTLTEGFNDMSKRLQSYFQSLNDINKANSRFVPRQFLEFLGKESITDIELGDQVQKEMTILFSDIRDFTSISEKMTPKENFDFINSYLGYMEPVIRMNNGFIDKFIGDSIMALFPENSEDAINSAIEMRIKLTEFNEIMGQFGKPAINSGIGIHTGMLMLGIIGGEGRMDGTVISDAVNLSSRVEGLTKIYGCSIVITEDTLININDPSHYHFRFLDVVKVKGKKEAVYVFEIIDGEPEPFKTLKIETKDQYNKAIQHYKKREFREALAILRHIEAVNPDDRVISLYMDRCERFISSGVPEHWDGVESLDYKF
jgi:class 3 adenylate cyclase